MVRTTGRGAVAVAVRLGADAPLLDVRTPEGFAEAHVEGAVNLDLQSEELLADAGAGVSQGSSR